MNYWKQYMGTKEEEKKEKNWSPLVMWNNAKPKLINITFDKYYKLVMQIAKFSTPFIGHV